MKIHNAIQWRDNLYLFHYRSVRTEPVEYFHAHEGLEILYIHEGTGKYIINNQTYPLQPCTLILVKPFQIHEIKVRVPPDYVRTLLKIKASVIESFLGVLPQLTSALTQFLEQKLSYQVFYLSHKDASYFEDQFLHLHETLAIVPSKFQKEIVPLFLFQFFTHFNSHIYSPGANKVMLHLASSGSTELIGAIVKWIDKHYNLSFTIKDMAEEFHFSPNYLSKLFKEQMGLTIIEYTNERRLEEAKMLLSEETLTVEEISKEAGFNYPSYFIAMFKKRYGMTPHRYRMRME
ncbi:helix-turn-helix domain-containing protein [Paenibacillus sp. HJL G12]|uniref:Helix-turn-helix domain-containing protein n=1 Tax=Paenibacillus dendrobii TaxID=2691084 RepID=A0A7X3IL52_9BACL|nr:AraC family transcriptional regulator [Paenibacillus dendrobii]MWV44072.1 helix-turn-helix domain-containing protein [Paenibacillus dendrobii]